MNRRLLVTVAGVAWLTTGCMGTSGSGLDPSAGARPAERFDGGLALADQGDLVAATESLVEVREVCGDSPLGRQALLLMSVMQLDGRNDNRNPNLAAELAATYLALSAIFPWTSPIAEGVYVLALEMGGSVPSLSRHDTDGTDAFGVGVGGSWLNGDQWIPGRGLGFLARPDDYPASLLDERVRLAARSGGPRHLPAEVQLQCDAEGADSETATLGELPSFEGSTVPGRLRRLERDRAKLRSKVAELEDELERVRRTLRP
ncbi:MAG: hypothetical protein ABFS14_01600 [Gemmatimonadota bacterium]